MRFPIINKARLAATFLLASPWVLFLAAMMQYPVNLLTKLTGLPWG